ncbi:MAG: helix-turn-helix transcriptional regulator [Clostridia bacterium]|nr:helix-turn-helix transcriptional regulator [Clostridia bacterium]
MNIKISENIKRMRRERDLSQEALANRLGVSYQTVSKWERGENYPDITLLPALASFFEVSVDTLLGTNEAEEEKEIKEIIDKLGDLDVHYMRSELAESAEEGLQAHPGNYELMMWVVYANYDTAPERAIELGSYVLERCTDSRIRNQTLTYLADAYLYAGNRQKAIEIAKGMPYYHQTSDFALSGFLEGSEQKEHIEHCCIDLAYQFWMFVRRIKKYYSHDEVIELFKKSNAVYDAIWESDDIPFKLVRKMRNYQGMAEESAALGRKDDALSYMRLAAECAALHDDLPETVECASILFDSHPYDRRCEAYMNVSKELLSDFETEDEFYSGLRDTDEYREIAGILKR